MTKAWSLSRTKCRPPVSCLILARIKSPLLRGDLASVLRQVAIGTSNVVREDAHWHILHLVKSGADPLALIWSLLYRNHPPPKSQIFQRTIRMGCPRQSLRHSRREGLSIWRSKWCDFFTLFSHRHYPKPMGCMFQHTLEVMVICGGVGVSPYSWDQVAGRRRACLCCRVRAGWRSGLPPQWMP